MLAKKNYESLEVQLNEANKQKDEIKKLEIDISVFYVKNILFSKYAI